MKSRPENRSAHPGAPQRDLLPADRNAVARQGPIGRHDREAFFDGLCDQDAVERIAVGLGQIAQPQDVSERDVELVEPDLDERTDNLVEICRELAQTDLDRDFPRARRRGTGPWLRPPVVRDVAKEPERAEIPFF